MVSTSRSKEIELVELSNAYFNKLGLSNSVKYFFRTDAVTAILQTTYKQYEETVKALVAQLPEDRRHEGEIRIEGFVGKSSDFVACVIDTFKIKMAQTFIACEEYVPMDAMLARVFMKAFVDEADGKMSDNVNRISQEVAGHKYAELCKRFKKDGLITEPKTN